jgi:hypothetical protein
MSYGFRLLNSAGYTQIDQDWSNWAVVSKGSFTFSGGTYAQVGIPDYGVIPMVFMKNNTGYFVGLSRIDLVSKGNGANFAYFELMGAPAGAVVEYMLAIPSNLIAAPYNPSGLKVYRADGSIAFSSQVETPRISAIYSGSLPSRLNATAYFNFYPAHSNPWLLVSPFTGTYSIALEGTTGYPVSCGIRLYNSNTVQIMLAQPFPNSYPYYYTQNPDVPVVTAVLSN